MSRFLKKFAGNEGGQSTVVLAISLTLILGCAALAVDLGADYLAKENVQDAADLAALSAARELPDQYDAMVTAIAVASENGVLPENVTVTTPYQGDYSLLEVICTKTNEPWFSRVFGADPVTVTGRAVAKMEPPIWAGSALPLLNVENAYVGDDISLWEKNSPGNFGVLYRKKMTWVPGSGDVPGHYEIECDEGVYIENGKIGALKSNIEEMCAEGRTVYLFSLSNEVVDAGGVNLGQATLVRKNNLVLLECTVNTYSFHSISVTVEAIYDIYGNYGDAVIPNDYTYVAGGMRSVLVE